MPNLVKIAYGIYNTPLGHIYTKMVKYAIFAILWAVSPHFNATTVKYGVMVQTLGLGLPPPRQIL